MAGRTWTPSPTATAAVAVVVFLFAVAGAVPIAHDDDDAPPPPVDLDTIIREYIERILRETGRTSTTATPGDYDEMIQSDQPVQEETNATDLENARRREDRIKWLEFIKSKLMEHLGRGNTSVQIREPLPEVVVPRTFNESASASQQLAEQFRTFNPSCEVPRNTDQDLWKDENIMNLFFNITQIPEEVGSSIALAILRLYRNSFNLTSGAADSGCEDGGTGDEERLLRVSIYYYSRPLRRHKGVKRRLCDSKVVGEHSKWVELNIKPALRAWSKGGRNLGIAVLVDDQDGNILKADHFFKGPLCTVGASTPRPIPSIIHHLDQRYQPGGYPGQNVSSTEPFNLPMQQPVIDICTYKHPDNITLPLTSILRESACTINRRTHIQERLRQEHIPLNQINSRHIRHQRGHHQPFDPRSRMEGQHVLITNKELMGLNITHINR